MEEEDPRRAPAVTALAPATAARLGVLADQLDAEALGRLPFGSGELAEALAQANAVRALARPAGGGEDYCRWNEEADSGAWKAQCGAGPFELEDGSPVENGMYFCFGCGRELVISPAPPALRRFLENCDEDEPDVEAADLAAEEAAEGPAAWGGGDPPRRRAPTPKLTEYEAASGVYRAERCLAHYEPEPCSTCAAHIAGGP